MDNLLNQPSPADTLLGEISQKRALDTNEWRAICIAMKNAGGSYAAFELWSLTGPYSMNHAQIRRAWDNLQGNYSIGTLIHYAKLDSKNVDLSNLPSNIRSQRIVTPQVPKKDRSKKSEIIADGADHFQGLINGYLDKATQEELISLSPVPLNLEDGSRQPIVDLLTHLYEPDDQLFIGELFTPSTYYSWEALKDPKERERCKLAYQRQQIKSVCDWLEYFSDDRKDHILPFIKPNPLTGEAVTLADGSQSYIGDGCVAKFQYAIVEFDNKAISDQIAFWLSMIDRIPHVAALIHSGNKSIHGWIDVNCKDKQSWNEQVENYLFTKILEPLGADGACKNESRSSRLPGIIYPENNNIRSQKLLYLNQITKEVKYDQ